MVNEKILTVSFVNEGENYPISFLQPDLSNLVQDIISKHLVVSKENIHVACDDEAFDEDEFISLLIEVHEEFSGEIEKFFSNVKEDIVTFYDDEGLGDYIVNQIKKNHHIDVH